jgi:mRNA-degrading endonuclease RelE of RelBE toxin-antitoxin system
MPTTVNIPPAFRKRVEYLRRRYPAITKELDRLLTQLENDERPGSKIPSVGYDVYKVRLKNPSAGKGKRGGFRVIYYLRLADHVILLTIYSKSDQSDISIGAIRQILEEVLSEFENENDEG